MKQTRKNKISQKNKTSKKIHHYISKTKDICGEEDIDRDVVIQQILQKYRSICEKTGEPEEYLNWINNDILIFIGYKVDLMDKKDKEGDKLWEYLNKEMMTRNKVSLRKVKQLLMNVPLYFLMAFSGYASYKELFTIPLN